MPTENDRVHAILGNESFGDGVTNNGFVLEDQRAMLSPEALQFRMDMEKSTGDPDRVKPMKSAEFLFSSTLWA